MLNEEFILKLIEPYLNSKRELSEFEFLELFSDLSLHEQYEVIKIMIAHDIEYVDEKEEEAAELETIQILKQSTIVDISNMLHLTNEQLCLMAQCGDINATAAILEKNKKFVYKLAAKLRMQFRTNLSVDDLFQEGNFGLIEAINHFDVSRDNRFITYSWHWVRQRITRATINTGYLIRLPVHIFDKMSKLNTFRSKYPEASTAEIAAIMSKNGASITEKEVAKLAMLSELYINTISLNTLVGNEENSELQDFIPTADAISVEDEIMLKQLRIDVMRALSFLKPREAQILKLRYGIEDGKERTLEEIGCIFNLTRERIRQIEAKALKKLRHPNRAKILKSYFEED